MTEAWSSENILTYKKRNYQFIEMEDLTHHPHFRICLIIPGEVTFLRINSYFRYPEYVYCLNGDAKILMQDGSLKLVKDIKIGDLVQTMNKGEIRIH